MDVDMENIENMEAMIMGNITHMMKELTVKKIIYDKITKENELLQEILEVLEKLSEAKQQHQQYFNDSSTLLKQQKIISYMQNEIGQFDHLQSLLSDGLRKKQQLSNELTTTRRQYPEQVQMLIANKNVEVDRAVTMAKNRVETIKIQLQAEYRTFSDEVGNARIQLEAALGEKIREKDNVLLEIYKSQQDNANLLNYVLEENKRYMELSNQKSAAASQTIGKSKSQINTKKFKKSNKEIPEEPKKEALEAKTKTDTEEKKPPIPGRKRLFSIEEHIRALQNSYKCHEENVISEDI